MNHTCSIRNVVLVNEERRVDRSVNGQQILSVVEVLHFDGIEKCVA